MSFFSIILPTYNRAAMTRLAVRSVLKQTFADWELLVVDDGSTDETPAVAKDFNSDARVRWTRMEENRGQHACRNDAIRQAKGRFITFLDSDDAYLPERLEKFKQAIEARPQAGFVYSNAYLYRDGRIIGRVFDPRRELVEGKVPGWYAVGERHIPYLTTNLALTRELFDRIGLYREDLKILEDTELYARMLASGAQVAAIRDCLSVRTLHIAQITRDYAKDLEESLIAARSGGAEGETLAALKKALERETATYFLKDLQPAKAREHLTRCGGAAGPLYWATYTPVSFLKLLKDLRRVWLSHGAASPADAREFEQVERYLKSIA